MENAKIKEDFYSFKAHYNESEKNEIWNEQSKEFKFFWENRILNPADEELHDHEIDDIVKILDRHGKGNNRESEAVARVMIPQGAWRRLFNQLKEDTALSGCIDKILKANHSNIIESEIDRLYELNKDNKNNLTGKSANAINSFLAAFDPFRNLSIVSINDRNKLLAGMGIPIEIEALSTGKQVVKTSEIILSKFNELNLTDNARTISAFVYSSYFIDKWKRIESTIEPQIIESDFPEINDQENMIFYMEKQLEDFLIENWDRTELGKKYDLINNEDGLASQQFRTEIGTIDILARDKSDNRYVVIELKKNQSSDDTIGQIARYMGWVEEHLDTEKPAKGIIIAGKYDNKLKYAMKKIKDIEVYLYKVNFHLQEYNKQ